MKQFFIALIVVFLAIRISGFFPSVEPLQPQTQSQEQLLPEFLEPQSFADVRRAAETMFDDECVANAIQAGHERWRKSISHPVRADGSHGRRAQVTAYVVCIVQRAELVPQWLCAGDARNELTRYVRGYFRILHQLQNAPKSPPAFAQMQRRMDIGSDIESGEEDFSPDPRIIDGMKTLIRDGVYTEPDQLAKKLSPEVPSSVIDELTAIQPGEAICHE